MWKYLVKRLLLMIPTLFGITLITFFIMHLAPGDSVTMQSGGFAVRYSEEALEKYREAYGFNDPLPVQYGKWVVRFIKFDFGNSLVDGRPVGDLIKEKLPVTIYLNLISIFIIFLISIPSGVKAAVKKDGLFDKISGITFFILYSLFVPWVAIFLVIVFSVKLNIFPLYGITSEYFDSLTFFGKVGDVLHHTFLPVIVMSYTGFAFLSRISRSSVLEVLNQEYIVTARAKGLPEKQVIRKHAVRNALLPLVTLFGSILPSLVGGSVIIERIFNIDGIGNLFFYSVLERDSQVIMGLTSITAVLTLCSILLSDILYAVVDPRIKYN